MEQKGKWSKCSGEEEETEHRRHKREVMNCIMN